MLGLIAGAGGLPKVIAEGHDGDVFIVRLQGLADESLTDLPGETLSMGQLGGVFKALENAGATRICFAGRVYRPDFNSLKLDWEATKALPGVLAAAAKGGDDALMRAVLKQFEKRGFEILPVEEAVNSLIADAGPLGQHAPDEEAQSDIEIALRAADAIGALDIGQGAVASAGVVLALEAQEGTDAMLARVADLDHALKGDASHRRGVLVKTPKPIQDRRIDLPTIGVATLEGCAQAGLKGVAVTAGGALIAGKARVREAADRLGLFVYGIDANDG